ncbi:MAG: hypothetical protein ACRC8Q_04515, partial [Aeromonas sp.]
LQELAFLCNMSLSTFKRTFISIFNQPPRKWLNHKKMTYAQKLISVIPHLILLFSVLDGDRPF